MKRIPFIDGLRGIAACSVVLFHFNDRLHVGSWPGWLIERGKYGVALFFVLSGFVITMSVASAKIDTSFLGRFVLRRSLRLDPPYWCSIAVIMFIAAFGARFGAHEPMPTFGAVIAHLFYLQDILRIKPISPIYWSLCLEIQFYLFIVLILWFFQRTRLAVGGIPAQAVFAATMVGSMLCRQYVHFPGTLMQLWFCFATGALAFWGTTGVISRRYAALATALVLTYGIVMHDEPAIVVGLSSGAILTAAAFNRLDLLSNRVSQFLGRISYSLYLTHLLFGWYALSIAMRYMSAVPAFILACVVCIVSAWVWYLLIERPSITLSRKIRVAHSDALHTGAAN